MIRYNTRHVLLSFDKDGNEWYADIPQYEGSRADLQMVSGADIMCDILAQGETRISRHLKLDAPISYQAKLVKIENTPLFGGANYICHWSDNFNLNPIQIWLCEVTEYVFGSMPDEIYIL